MGLIRERKILLFLGIIVGAVLLSVFLFFSPRSKVQPIDNEAIEREEFAKLPEEKQFLMLKTIAENEGSEAVWDFIKSVYPAEEGKTGPVHALAHYAGEFLYADKGFEGFAVCTPDYAFGCYHGFLDVAFVNGLERLPEAENACLSAGPERSGPNASCIHGIGHGIASFYKVEDLGSALAKCEELTQGDEYCFDGVFMEFEREADDSFYTKEDPIYPCNSVEEKYVYSCGRNQVSIMGARFGMSFEEMARICSSHSNIDFQNSCFEALGFQAAYRASNDPEQIFALCQSAEREDLEAKCTTAAAGELVFQNMPNWQENAPKTCGLLTGEYHSECSTRTQQIMSDYGKS